MGTMHHHAIVVTGWNPTYVAKAHAQATKIFEWVSPISPQVTNGYSSFFIPPDGSKEGWEESNRGSSKRDGFISWLSKSMAYDDLSHKVEWAEIGYGDEGHEVDRSNDSEKLRAKALIEQQIADRKDDDEKWAQWAKELGS